MPCITIAMPLATRMVVWRAMAVDVGHGHQLMSDSTRMVVSSMASVAGPSTTIAITTTTMLVASGIAMAMHGVSSYAHTYMGYEHSRALMISRACEHHYVDIALPRINTPSAHGVPWHWCSSPRAPWLGGQRACCSQIPRERRWTPTPPRARARCWSSIRCQITRHLLSHVIHQFGAV